MSFDAEKCRVCGRDVESNAEGRIVCSRKECVEKIHEITHNAFRGSGSEG